MIWWKISQSGRECGPSNICQDHEQNVMPITDDAKRNHKRFRGSQH